jgi:hypothetical protein
MGISKTKKKSSPQNTDIVSNLCQFKKKKLFGEGVGGKKITQVVNVKHTFLGCEYGINFLNNNRRLCIKVSFQVRLTCRLLTSYIKKKVLIFNCFFV